MSHTRHLHALVLLSNRRLRRRWKSRTKAYIQCRLPPKEVHLARFNPVELLVYKLHVVRIHHLGQLERHLPVSETTRSHQNISYGNFKINNKGKLLTAFQDRHAGRGRKADWPLCCRDSWGRSSAPVGTHTGPSRSAHRVSLPTARRKTQPTIFVSK